MRGRKPTPTVLKLARGNPGKRPITVAEPVPDSSLGIGDPPSHVTGEALAEWHRLGPQLETLGTLTHVDRPAFVAYCTAWARFLHAEDQVASFGEVVKAPSGYPMPNPYRAVANKAYQQCKEFWLEFGMTASARTRIHATPRRGGRSAADVRKDRFFGISRLV